MNKFNNRTSSSTLHSIPDSLLREIAISIHRDPRLKIPLFSSGLLGQFPLRTFLDLRLRPYIPASNLSQSQLARLIQSYGEPLIPGWFVSNGRHGWRHIYWANYWYGWLQVCMEDSDFDMPGILPQVKWHGDTNQSFGAFSNCRHRESKV